VSIAERAALFECEGERLVGIVTEPASPCRIGVLVVVGGPQYRVGSHRQFVLLARRLASEGVTVMRFDCRGMGDGTGPMRSFEDFGPDVSTAIDAMIAACPGVEQVVLLGMCDAASAELSYWQATEDPRVCGMVLLNPWVRSQASMARTQIKHYYGKRLLDRAFWKKLVRGDVDVARALGGVGRSVSDVVTHRKRDGQSEGRLAFQDRMAEGLRSFGGPVLLIISGRDLTAKEFLEYAQSHPRWAGLLDRPNIVRRDVDDADHTFSSAQWRGWVESTILDWLRRSVLSSAR